MLIDMKQDTKHFRLGLSLLKCILRDWKMTSISIGFMDTVMTQKSLVVAGGGHLERNNLTCYIYSLSKVNIWNTL